MKYHFFSSRAFVAHEYIFTSTKPVQVATPEEIKKCKLKAIKLSQVR